MTDQNGNDDAAAPPASDLPADQAGKGEKEAGTAAPTRPADTLHPDDFPATAFDDALDENAIRGEIAQLRERTLKEIGAFFAYYHNAATWKKRIARFYRIVAVGATVIAGILLVLSHQDVADMFTKQQEPPAAADAPAKPGGAPPDGDKSFLQDHFPIPGGWAILLGLIAGAALGADRMSGTSKGWMRYVLARQELEALRHRYENELLTAEISGKALYMIAKCQEALQEVDDIVFEETKQWVRDYREDLEQLQQAVSKYRPSEKKPKS